MDTRGIGQIAVEDRADVALEEPCPGGSLCPGERLGEPTGEQPQCIFAATDRRISQHRHLAVEQLVEEVLPATFDLTLRQWPEGQVVDASRERIGDCRDSAEVRGASEQKLSAPAVTVKARFDRQQQIRRALHLVDYRGTPKRGHEALRIGLGRSSDRIAVERHVVRRDRTAGEHAGESALARLTSAEQRDRPGALHGVDNDRSDAPLDERLGWKNVRQLGKY